VFLSPGPNDIWYPYAVSKRPPAQKCALNDCLVLSGEIMAVARDHLQIKYQYEHYVPTTEMLEQILSQPLSKTEVSLSIGKDGRAIVRTLHINGA